MPGAGHLVHMPGHIYIRVGRYLDAVQANEHAVHADETYIRDQQPGMGMYTAGYYPHNYDFMAFAAMKIGRGETAISSAESVTRALPAELFGSPGMDFLQHWSVRPLQIRIRFARWDEILVAPQPVAAFPHATALWRYARGRAFVAQGDVGSAERELAQLRVIAGGDGLDGLRMEYNAAADLVAIAERVLTGWIASAAGSADAAEAALRDAVALEDGLRYGEPPEWSVPTRQDLGAVLLAAGRNGAAEQAFRDDLDHFPENGWSLRGLATALRAQGRTAEADAVDRDFRRVWATADVDAPTFVTR
jgi:tetratricopeptide (TPR) repeat protein